VNSILDITFCLEAFAYKKVDHIGLKTKKSSQKFKNVETEKLRTKGRRVLMYNPQFQLGPGKAML
jgi:hypothetical protein